jgi:hypothetical protein
VDVELPAEARADASLIPWMIDIVYRDVIIWSYQAVSKWPNTLYLGGPVRIDENDAAAMFFQASYADECVSIAPMSSAGSRS